LSRTNEQILKMVKVMNDKCVIMMTHLSLITFRMNVSFGYQGGRGTILQRYATLLQVGSQNIYLRKIQYFKQRQSALFKTPFPFNE